LLFVLQGRRRAGTGQRAGVISKVLGMCTVVGRLTREEKKGTTFLHARTPGFASHAVCRSRACVRPPRHESGRERKGCVPVMDCEKNDGPSIHDGACTHHPSLHGGKTSTHTCDTHALDQSSPPAPVALLMSRRTECDKKMAAIHCQSRRRRPVQGFFFCPPFFLRAFDGFGTGHQLLSRAAR
jgi:hypothetical protein